jgi:hypothetical protein
MLVPTASKMDYRQFVAGYLSIGPYGVTSPATLQSCIRAMTAQLDIFLHLQSTTVS